MTDATAKKIFDILLNELRSNGFTDVGTFMIDEVSKENEYEEFDEKYEYVNTDTVISKYEALSKRAQGGVEALRKLIDASLEYFTLANQIPDKFSQHLNELSIDNEIGNISLMTIDEKEEDVGSILKSENVEELVEMLTNIRENMDQDDDTFLNSL
ncbi:MAG: hypothetical protein RIC95_10105 [Vicingaceae bacterium]